MVVAYHLESGLRSIALSHSKYRSEPGQSLSMRCCCVHVSGGVYLVLARARCLVLLVRAGLHVPKSADFLLKIGYVASVAVAAEDLLRRERRCPDHVTEVDTAPEAAVQGREKASCYLLFSTPRSSTRVRCAAGGKGAMLL